ncbi:MULTISPECIES: AlpA family transcriptional regulator [unclassified Roseovarius]|uniref:helix-turn-helix transcriptional regulator n=1 Tax=unclassified Roseovarius TaxID=2614913 RepID=UPI00273EA54C|nr:MULTISPECIES: DNA-binding protein [unclassified Roseovarius]
MAKITQVHLAARWQISPRTLEQWRWLGKGPKFLKIGARVLYDEIEVEAYEASQVCQNTNGPISSEGGS